MSRVAIDFHVHTSYSDDCPMPPRLVIEIARRRGLQGIAVTDHDTVAGALATAAANRYSDFLVIPGIEVKTDWGDVIGLFIGRQIENRNFDAVIQEIHAQGGLVYVPHPIRTFGAERTREVHASMPGIDLWELYNGRYESEDMVQSRQVFESLGISAPLCGSDAHFPWDVGVFRTVLEDIPSDPHKLLQLSRSAKLEAPARSEIAISAGITLGAITKACKRRQYGKAGRFLARLPWKAARKAARIVLGRRVKAGEDGRLLL